MRGIGGDQAIPVLLAEEAHALIVERDRLYLEGRKVMNFVMNIDHSLQHRAIAILTSRVMAGQIGAPETLPCPLGLAQAQVADQAIELADSQDVGRAGGLAFDR